MSKEPLYPHVPKSRQPQLPHATASRQKPPLLPLVIIDGGEPVSPEYRHLLGWVAEPLPKDAD